MSNHFKKTNHIIKSKVKLVHGITLSELEKLVSCITDNNRFKKGLIQEMVICLLKAPDGFSKRWYKELCYWIGLNYMVKNDYLDNIKRKAT